MVRRKSENAGTSSSKKRRIEQDAEEEEMESEDEGTESNVNTSPNKEAEVGIVERVILKNFMCHGRLDIKMGPNINFIIGRNGSGKSAVVTALVVGLGGKASVTNRGSTIKSFIKSGKQTAEVEIQIRNRGTDAFKPSLYGDSIIVQRKFTADGGSRYVLKSHDDRVVSEKREELIHMLDQMNIQVENPVAILNQDTSRNFLHSKSPQDKYKFFLKATQLEQMQRDYTFATEQKNITNAIIEQKERTMPKLRDQVLQWEHKFKNLGALSDLKAKVKALKNEMAWAFVLEKEKGLEPLQKALRTEEARLPKFVQKVEESKEKMKACEENLKKKKEEVLRITQEVERLMPQLKERRDAFSTSKVELRSAFNAVSNINRDLKSAISDRKQLMERIHELQKSAQHDYEAERLARQHHIEKLEGELRSEEAEHRVAEHEREQFQAAVSKYKTDIYNLERDLRAKQEEINQCQRNLQTLKDARSNRVKRFGSWVPSALEKIEEWHRQGRFHRKPLGPLGSCFQLKEQCWSVAAEACLRGLIHSFACHDHHDEKLLEQILREVAPHGRRPSIITAKFRERVHDVSKFRVRDSPYPAVLDVIQCDDPVVLNTLIDQRGIENIILITEAAEARNVMMHRPPSNCNEAFTREGDQLFCQPTFRYYSSDTSSARCFLTSDVEREIVGHEKILVGLNQEVKKLQDQKVELQNNIRSNQQMEKRCETKLMKLGEKISNLKYELKELRSVEDPVPVDISTLEEDVETYSQQILELEDRRAQAEALKQEKQQQCNDAETHFHEMEAQMKALTDSDLPLKEELTSFQNDLDVALSHKRHYQTKLKEQEKNIEDHKKNVAAMQQQIQADEAKAAQICPERINTRRTPRNLESEINQINIRITQEEKSQGNPEEITRQYNETQMAYKKLNKEVNQFKRFLENLDRVMAHRNEAYARFQRTIALRTKYNFIMMLAHRKYIGKMIFNHSTQTLDMWVSPTEQTDVTKDLKSLSGGERSFATVCFILSLWNAMESPFRCLDEFDVFMDMVNRRISMDMMLQVAKTQKDRQFIFLTPQDMSQLNIGRECRIFRMPDPDRTQGGQTTLTSTQE
ncbi:structural maintenance of chromosomes protein 6-like isoform X2 [Pomacea canaliculata]|nr:structural maintenance of chromosomes protein 6-like isoform X2 [Pomacea canaliculata]